MLKIAPNERYICGPGSTCILDNSPNACSGHMSSLSRGGEEEGGRRKEEGWRKEEGGEIERYADNRYGDKDVDRP